MKTVMFHNKRLLAAKAMIVISIVFALAFLVAGTVFARKLHSMRTLSNRALERIDAVVLDNEEQLEGLKTIARGGVIATPRILSGFVSIAFGVSVLLIVQTSVMYRLVRSQRMLLTERLGYRVVNSPEKTSLGNDFDIILTIPN